MSVNIKPLIIKFVKQEIKMISGNQTIWPFAIYYFPLYEMNKEFRSSMEQNQSHKFEEKEKILKSNEKGEIQYNFLQFQGKNMKPERTRLQIEYSEQKNSINQLPPKIKWENTNKNKNIFPNTINRMISFLSCKARSSKILNNFLQKNPHISEHCNSKTYFSYIKQLKQKMSRCLMKETIQLLFEYCDPEFQLFTKEQQECFARINLFLFQYYSKTPLHVLYITHSNSLEKKNVPDYIRADREILNRIQLISNSCEILKNSQIRQYKIQ